MMTETTSLGTSVVFWACALIGTIFFVIRVALMLVGGIGHELGTDADVDHSIDHADVTGDFSVISITSLAAFLGMFGWAGLSCYVQFHLPMVTSLLISSVAGLLMMFSVAGLFHCAKKLVTAGADFKIEALVGKTASVYQKIPADGLGMIQLPACGMTREVRARSEDKVEIPSFEHVQVVRIIDSETVSVKRVN